MLVKPLQHTATALTISIRAATGRGPTALAAFDDALVEAGVANYNLIRLSSVIPPGSVVEEHRTPRSGTEADRAVVDLRELDSAPAPHEWGHRLYAVWAFQSAELLGQEAWAGVAWTQDPETGRGLFVEHEGSSEAQVREELSATLGAISRARGLGTLPQHSVVTGAKCEGEPVAALVIAPYMAEGWS